MRAGNVHVNYLMGDTAAPFGRLQAVGRRAAAASTAKLGPRGVPRDQGRHRLQGGLAAPIEQSGRPDSGPGRPFSCPGSHHADHELPGPTELAPRRPRRRRPPTSKTERRPPWRCIRCRACRRSSAINMLHPCRWSRPQVGAVGCRRGVDGAGPAPSSNAATPASGSAAPHAAPTTR